MIISSNKTQLTHFCDKQAYLVYLTIGNIPKDIHQKPLWHAQLLIAYLPTTKLGGISNKSAQHHALANLFHACIGNILDLITSHGETGVPMMSSDVTPSSPSSLATTPSRCLSPAPTMADALSALLPLIS